MDGKTILPRSEVPEEFTWDLSDVFASDDKWSEELEALKAYPERMAAYAGKLGESAKTLLDWFTLSDEITVRVSKFVQYASCRSDQDVGNSFYQGMRSKAFSMSVALNSAGSFEASEIMAIPDETLAPRSPHWKRWPPPTPARASTSCAAARHTSFRPSAKRFSPPRVRSAKALTARSACSTMPTCAIPA